MENNIFTASASESGCTTVAALISFHKLLSVLNAWPLLQRSDLGGSSNPPGRILQSAANFAHLLFPKIHHCQMDPAILTHTGFPVGTHKHTEEGTIWMKAFSHREGGDYRKEDL